MTMNRVHVLLGTVTIAVFVATGFYLRSRFTGMPDPADTIRFLYRANHVYILVAGIVNLAMGLYLVPRPEPWRYRLQLTGSVLLWLAPLVLVAAFVHDPPRAPHRLLSAIGIIMLLVGTVLHVPGRVRRG